MFTKRRLKKQRRTIDFEDLSGELLAEEHIDESTPERMPVVINKVLIKILLFFVFAFFSTILIRISYLQMKSAAFYQEIAEKSRSQINWIIPHRGIIFDRNENQLVYNIPAYNLVWDKNCEDSDTIKDEQLEDLDGIINLGEEKIYDIIENGNGKIMIKEGLSKEEAYDIKSKQDNWKNIIIEERDQRDYPNPYSFSHVLGYIGKTTKTDFKNSPTHYLYNDYIGKSGIESQYEDLLRGKLGIKSTEVSPHRDEVRPISQKDASDGVNISLTIDMDLQNISYEALSASLKENSLRAGSVLAINPKNGEILSMVSLPTFNNSALSQGMNSKDYSELTSSESRPFFNRVIGGLYPPGSTFKPLIALAALEENIINSTKGFNCQGFLRAVNIYNPEISYIFRDWKTHGWVTLKKAIAESCNVYFYMIGGGYKDFEGLGIKKIKAYADKFGLTKKMNVDISGESTGLIPDKAWKKKIKKEDWYIGDTYNTSIGQGNVALSPLQVSQIYSLFANNGIVYEPHLLKSIQETPGGEFNDLEPKILIKPNFSQKNIDLVKEGLREAVVSGSAQILQLLPVNAAAKTGTAQYGDGSNSHAWFAAFAPYENPEIVLVVMVEEGGGGSAVAAPIAYKILKQYFNQNEKNLEN